MGEANGSVGVQIPKLVTPVRSVFCTLMDRLPAASGTAAGAGHDLHEVVLYVPLGQRVHQCTGIAQTADHCDTQAADAGDVENGLFPGLVSADSGERVRLGFFPVTR